MSIILKSSHFTDVQIVEAVFSAGKGQDHGVLRCLFDELCIVVASGPCTVASSHQEEVFIAPAFTASITLSATDKRYRGKAGHNTGSAVNLHICLFVASAQFQRFYNRSKICPRLCEHAGY